jgi:hypothetical protein
MRLLSSQTHLQFVGARWQVIWRNRGVHLESRAMRVETVDAESRESSGDGVRARAEPFVAVVRVVVLLLTIIFVGKLGVVVVKRSCSRTQPGRGNFLRGASRSSLNKSLSNLLNRKWRELGPGWRCGNWRRGGGVKPVPHCRHLVRVKPPPPLTNQVKFS